MVFLSHLSISKLLRAIAHPHQPQWLVLATADSARMYLNLREQVENFLLSAHEIPYTSPNCLWGGGTTLRITALQRKAQTSLSPEFAGREKPKARAQVMLSREAGALDPMGFGWHGENRRRG